MSWVLILLTLLVIGMLVLAVIDPGNPTHR